MRKKASRLLIPGLVMVVLLLGMAGQARAGSMNLVVNGTFDSDLSGWTIDPTTQTGVAHDSGTARIGQPGPTGFAIFLQGFTFSGTELSISFEYQWQVNQPFTQDFFTAELLYQKTDLTWITVQLLSEGSDTPNFGDTVVYYGQVPLNSPNGNAEIRFKLDESAPSQPGEAGTRVQLDNVYVGSVPEPATLSLLGIGLLVGIFARFRRKSQ